MAIQNHSRDAFTSGMGFTEWSDDGSWEFLNVQATLDGGLRISKQRGADSTTFTLPREIAQFLVLDAQEALSLDSEERGAAALEALRRHPLAHNAISNLEDRNPEGRAA
jgi:hypothetical protein